MSVQFIHRSLVTDYMYTPFFIGPVPSSWIFRVLLIFLLDQYGGNTLLCMSSQRDFETKGKKLNFGLGSSTCSATLP